MCPVHQSNVFEHRNHCSLQSQNHVLCCSRTGHRVWPTKLGFGLAVVKIITGIKVLFWYLKYTDLHNSLHDFFPQRRLANTLSKNRTFWSFFTTKRNVRAHSLLYWEPEQVLQRHHILDIATTEKVTLRFRIRSAFQKSVVMNNLLVACASETKGSWNVHSSCGAWNDDPETQIDMLLGASSSCVLLQHGEC